MVTIICACRNEAKHIHLLLDCLLGQEGVPEPFEIIIADGMSEDGTRDIVTEYARKHPDRIRLIDNPGRFVSSGLNAAIRASKGNVIVRTDAHTVYALDYVRNCLQALECTGADNVGGPARTRVSGLVQRGIAAAYHSPFGSGGARFHQPDFEGWVDTVTYGCWRKETLERIGLFDEEMIRNQDDELNLRLTRAGGKIWQSSKILSWYSPRTSLVGLFRQYFQYGFWKIAVIRKHRLPARWTHLIPGLFVVAQLLLPVIAGLLSLGDADRLAELAWGLWLAMNGSYGLAILVASVLTAIREGWDLLPILPVTFAVYHLSYGLGFVWGVISFVLLKRKGDFSSRFVSELTR